MLFIFKKNNKKPGVLPFRNLNWFPGDEMSLLAPTISRILQTILCLPNEYTSPEAKWKAVPGPLYLKKKRMLYVVN